MTVPLPLDEAVLRLKAEIIAQDWRLSPKRAVRLEEAFVSLREHFKDRRAIHAMLVMAANVLMYIKGHGTNPPDTIDFLKEAMAHVVSLHEELDVDIGREQEVLKDLLVRFNRLKDKIRRQAASGKAAGREGTAPAGPAPTIRAAAPSVAPSSPAPTAATDRLVVGFKDALLQAPAPGPDLARLFADWLASPAVAGLLRETGADGPTETATPIPPPKPKAEAVDPPLPVRVLTISGLALALPHGMIAMSRAISPSQAARYTQNAAVPLADFARLLRRLSSLFTGNLARIKEGTLRQLTLPLLIPRGSDLPETPAPESRALVVVSHGNWHGALVCDAIEETGAAMIGFTKQQNGDLSGDAKLDNDANLPLLDTRSMLQREGILLML